MHRLDMKLLLLHAVLLNAAQLLLTGGFLGWRRWEDVAPFRGTARLWMIGLSIGLLVVHELRMTNWIRILLTTHT
jgi:hypothetical protein